MSLCKIEKFLKESAEFDKDLPEPWVTPIILTDSKGRCLKAQVDTVIERAIIWWSGSGWNSEMGLKFLKDKILDAQCRYGRIHIYVWLGCCDLTIKTGTKGHICLNPTQSGDNLVTNFNKISEFARIRKFKVTFLEIPMYSIRVYNEYLGHTNPNTFYDDDKELQQRIKAVNDQIIHLNQSNQVIISKIPRFNNDLSNTRKNWGKSSRKYYTFGLLKDGLHPGDRLSKCWLRKICMKIRLDCYPSNSAA